MPLGGRSSLVFETLSVNPVQSNTLVWSAFPAVSLHVAHSVSTLFSEPASYVKPPRVRQSRECGHGETGATARVLSRSVCSHAMWKAHSRRARVARCSGGFAGVLASVSAVGAKPMAGRGSAWHTDGCGAVSGHIRYGALIQKRLDRSEDCVWWRDEIPYDRAALSTIYAVRRRDTSLGAFDKAERCTHNRPDNR